MQNTSTTTAPTTSRQREINEVRAIRLKELYSELEAISPDLPQLLDDNATACCLWSVETHGGYDNAVTAAEQDLLDFFRKGALPLPYGDDDPTIMEDWFDPEVGDGKLAALNAERRAWWLSHQLLRARLKTFLELEIPMPREMTQEDADKALEAVARKERFMNLSHCED